MIDLSKRGSIRTKPAVIAMTLALGLGACSHGIQIAEHADDYNVSVETAENRMFLRNIIRAAKRWPLHFTKVDAIQTVLKSEASVSPKLPFGSNSEDSIANGLSFTTSSSPTVTYKILNDQKFMNGLNQPVTDDMLDLFIHQGWPTELLLNVFVERVDVFALKPDGSRGEKICEVLNNPDDIRDMQAFQGFLDVTDAALVPVTEPEKSPFGPKLTEIADAQSLKFLKETGIPLIEHKNPVTKEPTGEYQLIQSSQKKKYRIKDLGVKVGASDLTALQVAQKVRKERGRRRLCEANDVTRFAEIVSNPETIGSGVEVDLDADIVLRSAGSMIYYLGQLSRVDIEEGKPSSEIDSRVRDYEINKRWTVSKDETEIAAVSIFFGATRYSIPEDAGRTMQLLALVSQVFHLNASSDAAPVLPQPLRLIGG